MKLINWNNLEESMTGVENFEKSASRSPQIASSKGFALIAALLAIIILTAVGTLAFVVTTQDVRISSRVVGEKAAFFAAESGTHWLMGNFDPTNLAGLQGQPPQQVDSTSDKYSVFTVSNLALAPQEPETLPLPGFSTGGMQEWGQERYVARVTGQNTAHGSNVPIDLSLGYGPVEISTAYR